MKFTKEQYKRLDKQLNEVVNSGMTIKEIANHLGISRSAVNRRLRALELNVPNYHNALKFDNTVFDSINSEEPKLFCLEYRRLFLIDLNQFITLNGLSLISAR